MTAKVSQSPIGAWTWEVLYEDGETYLRSERCFADAGMAVLDLQSATCLIRSYIQFR